LETKKEIKEEKNVIEKDEELVHKEPKEKRYENDVLGIVFITSNELESLVSQKKHQFHEFV
jgi:hypothetical protein